MIKIYLGGIGSGKTASCVRELVLNPSKKHTFSNIKTTKIENNHLINHEMIVKKTVSSVKRNGEEVYKFNLNVDFWKDTVKKYKAVNVIIDEAHSILSSRKSMSKVNQVLSDWLALLRRVLGSTEAGSGELIFISQLDRRLDVIAREMATMVKYHVCHYTKTCKSCRMQWGENNETPEPRQFCPRCKSTNIVKHSHFIEVWHFTSTDNYVSWRYFGKKREIRHYYINDIERYFGYYDTLQWDNLISEL